MPITVQNICTYMEAFAPLRIAEEWDNVGLLVGDRNGPVEKILTCLTITPDSVAEAVREKANLIVAHHPMPFRPVKRLTTDSTIGSLLIDLIRHGIAVYSPHTAFDSASTGINQQLAEGIGLTNIKPLNPLPIESGVENNDLLGSGRYGQLSTATSLADVIARVKSLLSIEALQIVGDASRPVSQIAVACGSAGQFLGDAKRAGCDGLLIGETNFHTCLEAEAAGVQLILPGHYASERFALEQLATLLQSEFPPVTVWASELEHDPLTWT